MTEQEYRNIIKESLIELHPLVEKMSELIAEAFQKGFLAGIGACQKLNKSQQ